MRDKFTEWLVQDHPRSCGKDWCKISYAAQIGGSPPLVRERLLELAIGCANHGITPARAGKTASTITTETDGGDHPRSCGKDPSLYPEKVQKSGSPPLVRERLL